MQEVLHFGCVPVQLIAGNRPNLAFLPFFQGTQYFLLPAYLTAQVLDSWRKVGHFQLPGLQGIVQLTQPLVGILYLQLGNGYLVPYPTLCGYYLGIYRFYQLAQVFRRKHVLPQFGDYRLFQLVLVNEPVRADFLATLEVILADVVMELAGLCRYAYHLGPAVLAIRHAAQKVFAGAFPWVHRLGSPFPHKRSYPFEGFLADNPRMGVFDADDRFRRIGYKFAVVMVMPVEYIVADIRFVPEHIIDDREAPLVARTGARAFAIKRSGYFLEPYAAQGHFKHALYDNRFGWFYGKLVFGVTVDGDFFDTVSVRRSATVTESARGIFLEATNSIARQID